MIRPRRAGAFALLLAAGACTSERPAVVALSDAVRFGVSASAISGPDSLDAGWTRLRVEEDGAGHVVVVFRLAAGGVAIDRAAFAAALDTSSGSPFGATAIGGAEVGDTSEVVLELTTGRYYVACVRRGRDGHRHAVGGEARELVVRERADSVRSIPPVATAEMPMQEFAYAGPGRLTPGAHLIRVVNGGKQDHQVRLARLREGVTIREWLDSEDGPRTDSTVAGVARMGPGATAYLPVTLRRGRYVVYCLIPESTSGQPHLLHGMFREIVVEE